MLCRTYQSVRYRYESLYRYRRYRYSYRTEPTEVSRTGIDIVPNLLKCLVPLAELTEVSVPVIPVVYTGGMPR